MVAESFTTFALGGKAVDLPGFAQFAPGAGVAWSLAFVVHLTLPSFKGVPGVHAALHAESIEAVLR